MNAEQAFALLVQANPVPDPQLLPISPELDLPDLPDQGDASMQTHDTPVRDITEPSRGRRLTFAIAASIAVLAIGGLFALWWLIGAVGGPVAAGDAHPTVTCDVASCSYDGPDRIQEGTVEFTLVNNSDEDRYLAVWAFDSESAWNAELDGLAVDSDRPLTSSDPLPAGTIWVNEWAAAGTTTTVRHGVFEGQYFAVDTVAYDGLGSLEHVWRSATIEIVAP
jgi:hypothetical protein